MSRLQELIRLRAKVEPAAQAAYDDAHQGGTP